MQVIAHRGSSGVHAEHTLQAFDAAISEGAHALECDVRLTRDGVLVCVHDRRVNRTSNGRGAVSALELADLSELDFTSWKRPQRPDQDLVEEPDRDHGRVLTLERLLELVLDAARPVRLHVETSTRPGTAGASSARWSTCSPGTASSRPAVPPAPGCPCCPTP